MDPARGGHDALVQARIALVCLAISSIACAVSVPPATRALEPGAAAQADAQHDASKPAYLVDPQMPVDFCRERADHWWALDDSHR